MNSGIYSWTELLYWFVGKSSEDAAARVLGETLHELKLTNARATVESDKSTILSKIASDFGGDGSQPITDLQNISAFDKADSLIRLAAVNGIATALESKKGHFFSRQLRVNTLR
jgi:hypothetical protein